MATVLLKRGATCLCQRSERVGPAATRFCVARKFPHPRQECACLAAPKIMILSRLSSVLYSCRFSFKIPCPLGEKDNGEEKHSSPTHSVTRISTRGPRSALVDAVASLGTSCPSSPDDAIPLAVAGLVVLGSAALPYGADVLMQYLAPRKCRCCFGAGYLPCPTCHGRGKVGGCLPGLELRSCEQCAARGRVRCEPCRHTGLANYWLWSPADDPGWGARGY
ncbi:hypothetical protein Vretifemale_10805 [Volvox reticuliferus]|uniref:Uncharacterized protein n=1 Tax=Volvox reticuliferus TaxID=1737510 RepID=A0A8J4CHC3_9CHLO|nr:hypothetical protein Vretifemale_10805 [Volvox reticuliferus]